MNLSRLDRIILTEEDIKKLLSWRDENRELVRNFKPVLTEGVIEISDYKQYFKVEGSVIHHKVFINSLEILRFSYNHITWKVTEVRDNTKSLNIELDKNDDVIADFNTIFMSMMSYMVNYQNNIEYINRETVTEIENKKPKKNRKSSGNKNRVVKITKTIYRINGLPDKNNSAETPKIFTRHTESWKVRGHFRKLKSGKKIWIREHTKGNQQKETDPKTYKL